MFETLENSPVVIKAEHVEKHFVLRQDNSLKDRLLAFRAGHRNREEFTALQDVSLEIKAGHTVALIGHNGSGKSTLLKIVGGILDPSNGTISRRGRIAALLELGAGFHPDLSGRDNVYLNASLLGMSREETNAVFADIVAFAEIEEFIDTQVKFYSSGMYVRLAFAVAIHTDPDILLVDEVLAVGDEAFQRKCMDVIRRFQAEGRTILLVTHSLAQVLELADSAALLHHGQLLFNGEPREAIAQFRDLLEENRLRHEGGSPGTEASRSFELEASCTIEDTLNGDSLRPGNTLHIDISLIGQLVETDWLLSIRIDNTMGMGVFGAANDLIGVDLKPVDSFAKYRFSILNTNLGEGKYFVNVSVMDSTGAHLYDLLQAASFNASAPETSRGVIAMEYTLTQQE